jgi:hypothetical protein
MAIPWSFALGAVIPAIIGMGTTWFGSGSRTDATHQLILGLWQPDPLWVSSVQGAVSGLIAAPQQGRDSKARSASAFFWVRFSYLLAATSSALGHLYVMGRILMSDNSTIVGFVRMYVPFLFSGPSGVGDDVLVYGPWLFLQYDLIIISLSSLSWVYCLLTRGAGQSKPMSATSLILLLTIGALTIGPGATVSIALWHREGQFR